MWTYTAGLTSREQMKAVKLSKLTEDTINNKLFEYKDNNEEDKKRFAGIEPVEVQGALEKNLLWTYTAGLTSREQMKAVKLSKLTEDTINNKLFEYKDNNEEDKKRFAGIEPVEVQGALEKNLLWTYTAGLTSREQMKAVKLSKLTVDTINNKLFRDKDNNEEDKKRFAGIEPVEVQGALEKDLLWTYTAGSDITRTDEGSEIVQINGRYDQ